MNNAILTIRTNKNLKDKAAEIFESLGMNLSTAVNIFLKQTVIKQTFPCDLDTLTTIKEAKSTYPKGYFKLFGAGKNLDMPMVEDINIKDDGDIEL